MQKYYSSRFQSYAALLLPVMLLSGITQAQPVDWEIDPEHFSIVFEASHVGYQNQMGLFLEGAGSFRYDPATRELSAGHVEIQADSIFTNHDDRDNHLTGRDFLNARRNPLIVFDATDFAPGGDDAGATLTGNLTLLGETRPVVLDLIINKRADYPFGHGRETLGISANTIITRSDWGMDYGVADNLVGDQVTLRFEFEAIRQ